MLRAGVALAAVASAAAFAPSAVPSFQLRASGIAQRSVARTGTSYRKFSCPPVQGIVQISMHIWHIQVLSHSFQFFEILISCLQASAP